MANLSTLPPPPTGQTGTTLNALKGLPTPPSGQKGLTLSQISQNAANPRENILSKIGSALTSSEQGVAGEIASGAPASVTGEDTLNKANTDLASSQIAFVNGIHAQQKAGKPISPAAQKLYDSILQSHLGTGITQTDLLPHAADTNAEALGNTVGTGLDALSAGSFGTAVKGAKEIATTGKIVNDLAATGKLATKVATPVTTTVAKQTLGQVLKTIGTKTGVRSVVGTGTGYGYDVSQNLQNGKTGGEALTPGLGTLLGGAAPIVIGGVQAGVALSKDTAPRFINSLIKPNKASFSYGKDPGRTVSEMGITGNSLSDFANNIHTAKQDIGNKLGAIYDAPANAGVKINANDVITKLDAAISDAAKGGKGNQSVVTALQNTKDALLYEHTIDKEGNIVKVTPTIPASTVEGAVTQETGKPMNMGTYKVGKSPTTGVTGLTGQYRKPGVNFYTGGDRRNIPGGNKKAPYVSPTDFINNPENAKGLAPVSAPVTTSGARDLSSLSPQEAFNLKQLVSGQTKFTGNPSDDKTVNAVLKNIYGSIKEKLNTSVEANNPEIRDLNQKYADLTSAELATRNRDAIVKRADMIAAPMKTGAAAAAGVVAALASGGTAIPAILAGTSAIAVEKALESTAVKTRMAAWLGSQSPSAISSIIQKNPAIKETLYRLVPKLSSKLGQ